MLIFNSPDFIEKKRQIIGFSEAGQLRGIMQANIVEDFDTSRNKAAKKTFRIRLGEADSRNARGHVRASSELWIVPSLGGVPDMRRS